MPDLVYFLRSFGKAAVRNGGKALAGLFPFGETAFEIARDVAADYRRGHDEPPPVVELRGRDHTYTLRSLLGSGDVADVHLAEGHIVKVSRVLGGHVLLDNERRALTHLLAAAGDTTYRRYLPDLVESFAIEDQFPRRVHVFRHLPGFCTLEQLHDRHPALDGKHLGWIFSRLLTVLGFCHRQGIVHGAILPCHVLIHSANHGLQLIGWGQSIRAGQPISVHSRGYRDWYPPEVVRQQTAWPATDLFLAARCLSYLAGGDPACGRMPDSVPAAMRRFVETCLLERARMRPGDAWTLLDEFDELLHRLYGPPKFHSLT
jgi:serine/threonine protein kinase